MASDWRFEEEVEINSLQDLEDLSNKYGSELIVYFKRDNVRSNRITIYDDYME